MLLQVCYFESYMCFYGEQATLVVSIENFVLSILSGKRIPLLMKTGTICIVNSSIQAAFRYCRIVSGPHYIQIFLPFVFAFAFSNALSIFYESKKQLSLFCIQAVIRYFLKNQSFAKFQQGLFFLHIFTTNIETLLMKKMNILFALITAHLFFTQSLYAQTTRTV